MKIYFLFILIGSLAIAIAGELRNYPATPVSRETVIKQFTLTPIGRIERQGKQTFIRLETRYQDGLLGIDQWSHVWVFYWFDRNDTIETRAVLRVHPRGNRENPLTGVFATRSPMRPNLIALSLCRVISIKGTVLEIESIDAFDQTPVIDLKPHISGLDSPQGDLKRPKWAGQ